MSQLVKMRVVKVDEGAKEMVVERKGMKVMGEANKPSKNASSHGFLKSLPVVESSSIALKSDQHVILPYEPYMKQVHPRCSSTSCPFISFSLDGSLLTYLPSPTEFEFEDAQDVAYDPSSRHMLFFKRQEEDDQEETATKDTTFSSHASHFDSSRTSASSPTPHKEPRAALWYCSSLQSSKGEKLLRCEEVSSGVSEDIPVDRLAYAVRESDETCLTPYTDDDRQSTSAASSSSSKLHQKKHGKADASLDHVRPISHAPHSGNHGH